MTHKLYIALYGNPLAESSVLEQVTKLLEILSPGCEMIEVVRDFYQVLSDHASLPKNVVPTDRPKRETDIIVSIGGDGTFLRAVSWEGDNNIPVAGLNGGHLGYLTGWTLSETEEFARTILYGDYRVERRALIKVEGEGLEHLDWPFALNEVAVLKENTANMINVRAEIDEGYLADYNADGLIVSTPTGSTGYNLSVGGPILEPGLPAWVISPVAAHSLNMRPLVVTDKMRLQLTASSRSHCVLLSLDGRSVSIPSESRLTLTKASFTIPVVRRLHTGFADALREKLFWGISKFPKD